MVSDVKVELKDIKDSSKSVLEEKNAKAYIVKQLNKTVNIPLIGEGMEEKILGFAVEKMFDLLENFLPKKIYKYINNAAEGFPSGEMNQQKWIDYIAQYINEQIDIPGFEEKTEFELIHNFVEIVFKLVEQKQ